jgi:FkbM family methyltransferase
MPAALNAFLKKYAPRSHRFLSQSLTRTGFPVPKMLLGRPVWAHRKLLNQETERHVLRWIAQNLRAGEVFFDVGAHLGWMSLVAARKTGRAGKVVAFEPSPPLIQYLSYHKRVNGLPQMEIVPKAVTNKDAAEVRFSLVGDGNAFMNALVETGGLEVRQEEKVVIPVEAITLDSYSRQTGLIPALIKIDTEGAEILVCEGAKHLLAKHHPALIVAAHPLWLPEGQRIEEMFAMLKAYGYRIKDSEICKYQGADFGDYLFVRG